MKKVSKQKIAEIYAEALFEAANDERKVKDVYLQSEDLQKIFQEDADIISYFSSPMFSIEDKKGVISEISEKYDLAPVLRKFLLLVVENGRFGEIGKMLSEFIKIYMDSKGYKYVFVQSVKELSKKQDKDLQKALEELLSKKVIIKYEIKPEILGGLIIQYDNEIIDDSLKNKIARLEKVMRGA